MPRFILTGDILHPGKVAVVADTLEEAASLAEKGEFEIVDEQNRHLAFDWGGEYEVEDDESDPETD